MSRGDRGNLFVLERYEEPATVRRNGQCVDNMYHADHKGSQNLSRTDVCES